MHGYEAKKKYMVPGLGVQALWIVAIRQQTSTNCTFTVVGDILNVHIVIMLIMSSF